MRKSLEFSKDMFSLNLIAESNASKVVLALNAHQLSSTYIGDCMNSNACFCNLIFLHVRRETNQTALYLAKYALHNLYCI